MEKVKKPSDQKSLYDAFGTIYERLMNGNIEVQVADKASKALSGMNRTYALELNKSEINKDKATPFKD